jgi:hypothetical protein
MVVFACIASGGTPSDLLSLIGPADYFASRRVKLGAGQSTGLFVVASTTVLAVEVLWSGAGVLIGLEALALLGGLLWLGRGHLPDVAAGLQLRAGRQPGRAPRRAPAAAEPAGAGGPPARGAPREGPQRQRAGH